MAPLEIPQGVLPVPPLLPASGVLRALLHAVLRAVLRLVLHRPLPAPHERDGQAGAVLGHEQLSRGIFQ